MPQTAFTRRDLAAALCVVLIWGTNFIAMKYGLRELTPFQLGLGRYVFAALPLVLLVRPPAMSWRWVVLYGLCQGVGQFGLLFLSLHIGMSAALASVVVQTQVFFTALFAVPLLGEKVSRILKGALVLAAIGLACFGAGYLAPGGAATGTSAAGLLLCLAAAAMFGASNIVVRRAQRSTPQFDVVPFMVWSSLVPIVPFALLSLAFDPPAAQSVWPRASIATWGSVAFLGWLATIVAYTLWTGLLKRHPANRVAPFSLAVPLVGVGAGMLLLGDTISGWQWVGIAFVGASLAMVVFGARLARPPQA